MIQIGRYSFFDITYVNITAIKSFDDETYFFFQPDVNPEGWWIPSETMRRVYDEFRLKYVGPYIPIQPKPYLKEFRFPVD